MADILRIPIFCLIKSAFPLKKVRKILTVALLSVLGLILLVSILINIPAVQNVLVGQVTKRLSKQLATRVEISRVNFRLFNSMRLEGTLIEDHKHDTLLYAGVLQVRITDWFFIQDKPVLKFVGLEDAQVNLIRPVGDSVWNYQFLIDEFGSASSPAPTTKKQTGISLDLKRVDLHRVQFNIRDGWVGEDMAVSADRIFLDAERLDLRAHDILINELSLDKPVFIVSSYKASRPKRPPPALPPTVAAPAPDTLTPVPLRWNADNWKLIVKSITIKNGFWRRQPAGQRSLHSRCFRSQPHPLREHQPLADQQPHRAGQYLCRPAAVHQGAQRL